MSQFLKSAFSEPTGQSSFGRLAYGFVIACAMLAIAYAQIAGKPLDLGAWAIFLTAVGGSTYGIGKVAAAWGTNKLEQEAKPPAT